MPPRSSPTTLRPALVSSRARMLPVQPMPTTTASTSFSTVTIARSSSRKVRDGLRFGFIFLVEIGLDLFAVASRQTREADHLPCRLVAIAAIDRIGEKPLHRELEQLVEEHRALEARELGRARLQRLHRLHPLGLVQAVEVLVVGFPRPFVRGFDA